MKRRFKNPMLLLVMIVGLFPTLLCCARAQTFRILHTFTATDLFGVNSDGTHPYAHSILLSNRLYGTTAGGGSFGRGALFTLNDDGTGFTNLHSFTGRDGAEPYG